MGPSRPPPALKSGDLEAKEVVQPPCRHGSKFLMVPILKVCSAWVQKPPFIPKMGWGSRVQGCPSCGPRRAGPSAGKHPSCTTQPHAKSQGRGPHMLLNLTHLGQPTCQLMSYDSKDPRGTTRTVGFPGFIVNTLILHSNSRAPGIRLAQVWHGFSSFLKKSVTQR